jgi:hypothetical protein
MNNKEWIKHKFNWLRALVADQPTRGAAHDVGFLLALRYMQVDKGRFAWASINRLARDLGVARSSVLRALNKLIAGGWLVCKPGGHEHGNSNEYYLPQRIPKPHKGSSVGAPSSVGATKVVAPTHQTGSVDATQVECMSKSRGAERVRALRRETLSDPRFSFPKTSTQQRPSTSSAPRQRRSARVVEVDFRPRPALHRTNARSAAHRQGKAQPFPQHWEIGNAELATARTICGWDLPTAEGQFEAFRDKALDQGWTSHNWPAAWKTWCRRDREYAGRQQSQPVTGLCSGLLGAQQWLDEQNRKQSRRDEEPDE